MTNIPSRDFWMHKFGRNQDVDAAGEDVWDGGGAYEFPLVAFETSIVGLANDHPTSDGIWCVVVEGLDINGADVTEVATLNGATPVVLVNSYYRVNRAYANASGATHTNSGNIVVSHTGSASLAIMSPDQGQTQQVVYTLPMNVNAHFLEWGASATRASVKLDLVGTVALQTREPNHGWRTRDLAEISNTFNFDKTFRTPQVTLKGFSDVRLRVTDISTDDISVSGGFELRGLRSGS